MSGQVQTTESRVDAIVRADPGDSAAVMIYDVSLTRASSGDEAYWMISTIRAALAREIADAERRGMEHALAVAERVAASPHMSARGEGISGPLDLGAKIYGARAVEAAIRATLSGAT